MPFTLRSAQICVAAIALYSAAAMALDKPVGNIVLTVSGAVTQANSGAHAAFDMPMLEKLPQKTITTQTPWYPKPVSFTGPLLRDVLAAAGAKGSKIVAIALNDYKTDIPFEDARKFDPIVARLMNGKPMPIREKGPLFIVYPFDAVPVLHNEIYYNRSAWQLSGLKIQ